MKVRFTRDSVCAADDLHAPHEVSFSISAESSIADLVNKIDKSHHIPTNIEGGEAAWSLVSGIPVAVIALQWDEPRMLFLPKPGLDQLHIKNGILSVHANYHSQIDPDIVFEVLSQLRLNVI